MYAAWSDDDAFAKSGSSEDRYLTLSAEPALRKSGSCATVDRSYCVPFGITDWPLAASSSSRQTSEPSTSAFAVSLARRWCCRAYSRFRFLGLGWLERLPLARPRNSSCLL